ncbi:Cupin 2, conserved barrel domain protein [mine drainage metagenome]|uniref:Cupin 2, conserved barrel domain protein n=1 Tax=mine drainage metagenome TaxID=410659 RepID=T1C0C6_9ZZZZ
MGDCIHFHSFEGLAAKEFEKGIWIKFLSVGKVQLRHIEFEPGSLIPDHRHPEEVVTMILEGEMEMTVGGETRRVRPGEVFLVPSNTDHSGRIFGGRVVAVSWSVIR